MKPICIAVVGVPISGKTTMGNALAKATGVHFVDYEVAKKLGWPRIGDPSIDPEGEKARMRVIYACVHTAVAETLRAWRSIIVALPYTKARSWDFLQMAVEQGDGILKVVLCNSDFSEEELVRRMEGHVDDDGPITSEYWHQKKAEFQEPPVEHLTVHMEGGEEGTRLAVQQAIQYISE